MSFTLISFLQLIGTFTASTIKLETHMHIMLTNNISILTECYPLLEIILYIAALLLILHPNESNDLIKLNDLLVFSLTSNTQLFKSLQFKF